MALRCFLVLRVRLVLLRVQEGGDEERTPCIIRVSPLCHLAGPGVHTINNNITNDISEILLVFGVSVIFSQQPREVPQHRIALDEDLAIKIHNGDLARWIQLGDRGVLVFREFLEAVADVVVGNPGVFPKETDDLTSATACKVKA